MARGVLARRVGKQQSKQADLAERSERKKREILEALAAAIEAPDRDTAAAELAICQLREDLANVMMTLALERGDHDEARKFMESAKEAATQVRGARKVLSADTYAILHEAAERQLSSVSELRDLAAKVTRAKARARAAKKKRTKRAK